MHILIIPSWYPNSYNRVSGIFFKEQAEALAAVETNRVGVIVPQEISVLDIWKTKKFEFGLNIFREENVNTYLLQYPSIPKLPRLRNSLKLSLFKKLFKKYINEFGIPDIVHLHSFLNGDLALWIKQNFSVPFVVTEHVSNFERGILTKTESSRATRTFAASSYNFAVSRQLQNFLERHYQSEFDYLPNIVDTHFFTLKKSHREKQGFTFINVAFMNENKNQAMLIDAFAKAFRGQSGIKLLIVGDGPLFPQLSQQIKNLEIQEQVELYGRANRNEIKELLHRSDAFVLSSRYETFGVAIIEAMACGLPALATKCGGPEGIIVDKKLGLLCEIELDDLAKSLTHLYTNAEKFDVNYIREYVERNFSKEVIVDRLMKVYKSILDKRKNNIACKG